jgi:hypothetical protein
MPHLSVKLYTCPEANASFWTSVTITFVTMVRTDSLEGGWLCRMQLVYVGRSKR